MKKFLATACLILFALVARAQMTTVTATVTDSDGTLWANGSWKIVFQPNAAVDPNPNHYNINGTHLSPSVTSQSGSLSSGAGLSLSVYQNAPISPAGSSWNLTVCPNAITACGTYNFKASGSSMNVSTGVDGAITAPRFTAKAGTYGYTDTEAQLQLKPGNTYWNVTSIMQRCYTGIVWGGCGGSGGYPGVFSAGTGGLEGNPGSGQRWEISPSGDFVSGNDSETVAGTIELGAGASSESILGNSLRLIGPATIPDGGYGLIFPSDQGTGALTNDGSGHLSWQPGGSGCNTGSVAGWAQFSDGAGGCGDQDIDDSVTTPQWLTINAYTGDLGTQITTAPNGGKILLDSTVGETKSGSVSAYGNDEDAALNFVANGIYNVLAGEANFCGIGSPLTTNTCASAGYPTGIWNFYGDVTISGLSGTAPVCPNGADNALTQTGCNVAPALGNAYTESSSWASWPASGDYNFTGGSIGTATLPSSIIVGARYAVFNMGTANLTLATAGPTLTCAPVISCVVPPGTNAYIYEDGSNWYAINNAATRSTSTPVVNTAACIKAVGPPVVIGYCSDALTGGPPPTCTCN